MNAFQRTLLTIVIAVAVIGAFSLGAILAPFSFAQSGTVQLNSIEQQYADIYARVSPSVVSITVDDGSGSGFVYDTAGHIITNHHVVFGASNIIVKFIDGTQVRAQVVGTDADSDLAVIKVDLPANKLQPVTFADSDQLVVGQMAVAIGSPFGQEWTLTTGIVSALDRTISSLTVFSIAGAVQTDASINPGNSGGPLLDLQGRVIGVNSQIASDTRQNSGVGFAIPSNLTQRVVRELIDNGRVEYSYIGITGSDLTLTAIEALALPNDTRGVIVSDVVANGPASRAGLRAATRTTADVITAINGQSVGSIGELISYLSKYTVPGQQVTLNVIRGGQNITLNVTLESRD